MEGDQTHRQLCRGRRYIDSGRRTDHGKLDGEGTYMDRWEVVRQIDKWRGDRLILGQRDRQLELGDTLASGGPIDR